MPGPNPKDVKSIKGSKDDNRRTSVTNVLGKIAAPIPGSSAGILGSVTRRVKKALKK